MSLFQPDSIDVANAIVAYLQGITYVSNGLPVYVPSITTPNGNLAGVQLGEFKDVTDFLPPGGTNAICEVYANADNSHRQVFGGRVRDEQAWFVLSIVDMTNGNLAEITILNVRDAAIQPFHQHATLNQAGNDISTALKPNSGKYLRVPRNGKYYRAYVFEVETVSEWAVQGGIVQ